MWRLHVDPLPSAGVPHHDIVTYGQVSPSCTNSNDQVNLFDAKTPGTFDPKEAAFKRFVLFGHDNTCYGEGSPGCGDVSCPLMNGRPAQPKTSGVAEVRGNDAIVSLGILQLQAPPATRIAAEAGALMHELGHNLGLYNGGTLPTGDVPKVNHLSVMDYTYQLSGVPFTDTLGSTAVVGTRPDFAHEPLAQTLDESSLFESAGVGAPAEEPNTKSLVKYMHLHTSVCPCPIDPCTGLAYPSCAAYGAVAGPGGSVPPIDWNCDGVISPVGVTADINGNGTRDVQDPGGTAEWRSLLHDFQCQPSYPDGANGSTEQGAPQR
jgi:hypothetical protein